MQFADFIKRKKVNNCHSQQPAGNHRPGRELPKPKGRQISDKKPETGAYCGDKISRKLNLTAG